MKQAGMKYTHRIRIVFSTAWHCFIRISTPNEAQGPGGKRGKKKKKLERKKRSSVTFLILNETGVSRQG